MPKNIDLSAREKAESTPLPRLAVRVLKPAALAPYYLAGLAARSALRAPRLAKRAGVRGAKAAFLAGHLVHGGAQAAMAGALFKLSAAAAASEGFAGKVAGRAGSPGAPPSRLSKMIDLGLCAAVELYPLLSPVVHTGPAATLTPAPATPPLNDLPLSALFRLGADAHRERAQDSLGRLHAWRARRAAPQAIAPPPPAP